MTNPTDKVLSAIKKVYSDLNTRRSFDSNPLADLSLLENGLALITNPISSKYHEAIVNRILVSYHKAKAEQKNVPPAYKPGGEWDIDIKTRRANYLKALADNDIPSLSNLLKNFFRNSGAAGLLSYAYHQDIIDGNASRKRRFVNCILQDFTVWKDFVDNADVGNLSVPPIGNPWGYIIEGNLITSNSCRHHYYASHVKNLLIDVRRPVVAEIGGGYGGLAHYLLSSVKPCKYIDFDLPEVLLVAQYYLMNAFPEKKILLFGETEGMDISFNTLDKYDIILMPNFQLPRLAPDSADLFINVGSLSEMDYSTIEEYLSQITRICKLYFFHDNSEDAEPKGGGHIEVPASKFPISKNAFKRIYKSKSLWATSERYREYLYQTLKGS
ncbi:MAG: putative sugar O-methyltransferase [Candidatus Altiarchaeota archaeon]